MAPAGEHYLLLWLSRSTPSLRGRSTRQLQACACAFASSWTSALMLRLICAVSSCGKWAWAPNNLLHWCLCRSGRSGPSRRSVGGRRQRAADSGQSGSPATRCQAAHPTGRPGRQPLDIPHKQGACAVRNGDAMHPVIIIKGLDASGACSEVCQPMAHPAVSRLKDGETGSSASPAAQVDGGARRADSEAPSLAATSARGPPQLRQQESRLPAQVRGQHDARVYPLPALSLAPLTL